MVSFSIKHFFHKDLLLYLCIGCFVLPSIGGQLALLVHFYSLPSRIDAMAKLRGNRTSGRIHSTMPSLKLSFAITCAPAHDF